MAQRIQNEITQALQKPSSERTPKECALVREYKRRADAGSVKVYLQPARSLEWALMAEEEGMSFSEWIREQVMENLAGDSSYLLQLRDDNQKLADELRGTQAAHLNAASKVVDLEGRLARMEGSLMDTLGDLKQLAERR